MPKRTLRRIVVRQSTVKGAGRGAFSRVTIRSGARLGQYKGRVLRNDACRGVVSDKLFDLKRRPKHVSEKAWEDGYRVLDGAVDGDWTSKMNASDFPGKERDPNVYFTASGGIVSCREIKPGDELFVDYGSGYWENRIGA